MIAAVVRQRVEELDLTPRLGQAEYEPRLKAAQRRFLQLRLHLGGQIGTGELGPGSSSCSRARTRRQGWGPQAPGRTTRSPALPGVELRSADADEKRHHFLWRFYRELPGMGGMAAFDRSWYGRALVERIEATRRRAVEPGVRRDRAVRAHVGARGSILVKLWLHISDKEQMSRFAPAQRDPLRRWKLTDEDWRNREKAREYERAADEMFDRTDHGLGPWDLIPAENSASRRGHRDGDRPRRGGHGPPWDGCPGR